MIRLAFGLFEYLSVPAHNDSICSNNKSWFASVRIDFSLVNIDGFLGCGSEDIFEGRKVLREILGERGRYYLEIGEAYLKSCQSGSEELSQTVIFFKALSRGRELPERGEVFDVAKQMLE